MQSQIPLSTDKADASHALARVRAFLDEGSFIETAALSEVETHVITGYGSADGRLVYAYAQYGPVNSDHAAKIAKLYALALKMGAPVVGFLDSAGMLAENGVETLDAYGAIFAEMAKCGGVVPQISVVTGNCGGTAAFVPALSDFVIMSGGDAAIYLDSPATLSDRNARASNKKAASSGAYHTEASGLAAIHTDTEDEAIMRLRELISCVPSNNLEEAPPGLLTDDPNRTDEALLGETDALKVITSVADGHQFLEIRRGYGTSCITGFAKFNGSCAGIAALCGKITPQDAEKAARMAAFCDAFNIPLVSLTAADGYGYEFVERASMLKSAAALASVFAQASMPKVNIIIGQSSGSSYLVSNSRHIGADICYIWDTAGVAAANPNALGKIVGVDADASSQTAARKGCADNVIQAATTRKMIISALEMLASKRVLAPAKKRTSLL